VHSHSGYRALLHLRLVPQFATICLPLLLPKGKKGATPRRRLQQNDTDRVLVKDTVGNRISLR
jgi:hypothetical protein